MKINNAQENNALARTDMQHKYRRNPRAKTIIFANGGPL